MPTILALVLGGVAAWTAVAAGAVLAIGRIIAAAGDRLHPGEPQPPDGSVR